MENDVFISYPRDDRVKVEPIRAALAAHGLTVFFDLAGGIDAGDNFPDRIDRAVRAAKCVLGCWNDRAFTREWVRIECHMAKDAGKLVAVEIAPIHELAPALFYQVNRVPLHDFALEAPPQDWARVLEAIALKLRAWAKARDDDAPTMAKADALDDEAARLRRGDQSAAAPLDAPPTAETAPTAANSVEALFAEIDADPDACLDPLSYVEFAQRFRDTEQAQEATRRAEQLRAWPLIDKADPQAIAAFQRAALFPALATKAAQAHTRAMADVAAALRESRQARKAREAAFPQFSVWRDMLESGDAGPEMVIIPAGTFLMGTPEDEPGRFDNEGPQHQVTIDKPFGLGKYAVTYDEYDAYCTATDTAKPDDRGVRGRRPVTDISWDAITGPGGFLDWLNAQIAGAPYRLPSEAEWEYAARAGTTTAYSFGADPAALDAYAWFAANSEGTPQPVGMTRPNPWGLYDMHGNAFEWVQDCWHDDYHGAPSDGSTWMAGDRFTRYRDVVRGGDFDASPRFLRSAFRFACPREKRQITVGFRLAREVN